MALQYVLQLGLGAQEPIVLFSRLGAYPIEFRLEAVFGRLSGVRFGRRDVNRGLDLVRVFAARARRAISVVLP